MEYIIYLRTNLVNGKQYVGQTKDFRVRNNAWNCLKIRYANKILTRDRNIYGLDNFKTEILSETDNRKEAWELEQQFIDKFNTKYPNGYNMSDGGNAPFGTNPSQETRAKMSFAKKGKEGGKSIEIYQIKNGKILNSWKSASFAAKELHYSQGAICDCCKGKFNRQGNHHYKECDWYYKEDYDKSQ